MKLIKLKNKSQEKYNYSNSLEINYTLYLF